MPDPLSTNTISLTHRVTGLAEIIVTCGACDAEFSQPINPRERLSYIVCPDCNTAAPTHPAWDLLDQYEPRG
ncbi:MAG: hypothetical protein JWM47_4522 [Acidimicrobiales bacterium]|nr:hypothetical protein [Acidimicrobiales bacterium]